MKNLQNLGQALTRAEQKTINGGKLQCDRNRDRICEQVGRQCAELYCQFVPIDPIF